MLSSCSLCLGGGFKHGSEGYANFVLMNKDGTLIDKLVVANHEEIWKRVDNFNQSSGEYAV